MLYRIPEIDHPIFTKAFVDNSLISWRALLGKAHIDQITSHVGIFYRPGNRVLDAASGIGITAYACAQRYPDMQVVGMDRSEYAIRAGRKQFNLPNLKLIVGDLYAYCDKEAHLEEQYDIISCFDSLHEMDLRKAAKSMFHLLKQTGVLIIGDYDRAQNLGDSILEEWYQYRRNAGERYKGAFSRGELYHGGKRISQIKALSLDSRLAAYRHEDVEAAFREAGFPTVAINPNCQSAECSYFGIIGKGGMPLDDLKEILSANAERIASNLEKAGVIPCANPGHHIQ